MSNSRGSVLVDAMVGVLVTAVALLGLSTMAVAAATAISTTTNNTQQISFLHSYVNSLATSPQAVPTMSAATTAGQQVNGRLTPVTIWRVSSPSSSTLFASMPRWRAGALADCSKPTSLETPGCLTTQTSVTAAGGSIVTSPIATNWNNNQATSPDGASMSPGPVASAETKSAGGQATPQLIQSATADLASAYEDAASRGPSAAVGVIVGGTFAPGYYRSGSSIHVSSVVTLDGQNDPNAVFLFQAGSTLITASYTEIRLINGAQAGNVTWQVGSSATLGTYTSFVGTILAYTSITVTTGCSIDGGALAKGAAVTLDTNTLVKTPTSTAPSGTFPAPINLGSARLFSVMGAVAVTNTGATTMAGFYGSSSGTTPTGMPPNAGPPAEMRYVLRIRNATANGSVVFTDSATGSTVATINFLAGQDGYFYGIAKASGPINVSLVGASATISNVYFYEPPK